MDGAAQNRPEWDQPIGRVNERRPSGHLAVLKPTAPTVEEAIQAWIASRPYARSTVRRIPEYLESGRARGWRAERGIVTIKQLNAAQAAEYVRYLNSRGAAPATLRKVRNLFLSLAQFCAEAPGYDGLEGEELRKLKLPKLVERIPEALTEEECLRLIAAAETSRDRLIVETLLLSGMRVSELCALGIDSVELRSRPAFIHVRGSVHNPDRTKNSSERNIIIDYDVNGFGRGYVSRLRQYIEKERPQSYSREIFLSERQDKSTGEYHPLAIVGVQHVMKRLGAKAGIQCNPHRLRHTFATRCADNEVPMFQLQEALGHKSLDMVRRYYTTSKRAMARGFYKAFGAS